MKVKNMAALDLRLLLVFDAVRIERSVSRAAVRLGLTQPAVSHAIARLRRLFSDEVFVRTPRGMESTAFANQVAPQVSAILNGVSDLLSRQDSFEAARATRRFVIGMTDYAAFVVMPTLAKRLERLAPDVELVVRATDRISGPGMLEREEVELVVGGSFSRRADYLSSSALFVERSICAARHDHPAFRGRLTRRAYVAARHLHVSPWGERGYIDEMLGRQRVSRRIGVTVSHFLLAPAILEQTDLVATLPERVARPLSGRFALSLQDPPFPLGETAISQYWHRHLDGNRGLAWLRGEIEAVARDL